MENKKEQIKNLKCKMAMNRLLNFEFEKENIMEMKMKTKIKSENKKQRM